MASGGVTLTVRTCTLLWRPAARLVRFVLVEHPERGRIMLLTSDLELGRRGRHPALRAQVQDRARLQAGEPGRRGRSITTTGCATWCRAGVAWGSSTCTRTSADYRAQVRAKMHAYQVHLFKGVVAQGLMQYLSVCHAALVWRSFGSWLRTIREGRCAPRSAWWRSR